MQQKYRDTSVSERGKETAVTSIEGAEPAVAGKFFLGVSLFSMAPGKYLSGSLSPLAIILAGGYTSCSVHFLQVILHFEHSVKPRLIVYSVKEFSFKIDISDLFASN